MSAVLDTTIFDTPDSPPPYPASQAETQTPAPASSPDTGKKSPQRPRHPTTDRSIAGRKPDDYVFTPKESAYFKEEVFEIQSQPVQRAFTRTYERNALALFETDLIIPIIATDDEQAVAVFKAADAMLDKLTKWADDETARIIKIMEANGIAETGKFTDPLVVKINVHSPRAYPLIALYKAIDRLVALKSMLWLNGFLNDMLYKAATYEARVRLMRLARALWELHNNAIRELHTARRKAILEANEERADRTAELRAKRMQDLADKIQARQDSEANDDNHDPLGQEELEVEMGTTLDAAEAAFDAPKPARSRKAKSA